MGTATALFVGELLARYRFPDGHPFGIDRQRAFWDEAQKRGLDRRVDICPPRPAERHELTRFHTDNHVDQVEAQSRDGEGWLDAGDTPVFPGIFEAAASVMGTAVEGLERVMAGENRRSFQPVGGLHHARPHASAGFCVFNDLGLTIQTLREKHAVERIAYVDIDVHHGDGVYYSYEDDPSLIFADIHEDGRFLYPGTGHADEVGVGAAAGTKLNLPLRPGARDRDFFEAWEQVEEHLRRHRPQVLLFQCGADSLMGDPLAHLMLSPLAHAHAARSLCRLADEMCDGRLLAFGGGGYDLDNLAMAWCAVLEEMVK